MKQWRSFPELREAAEVFGEDAVQALVDAREAWQGLGVRGAAKRHIAEQLRYLVAEHEVISPKPSTPRILWRGMVVPEVPGKLVYTTRDPITSWTMSEGAATAYCLDEEEEDAGPGVVIAARGVDLRAAGEIILWPPTRDLGHYLSQTGFKLGRMRGPLRHIKDEWVIWLERDVPLVYVRGCYGGRVLGKRPPGKAFSIMRWRMRG